MRLISGEQIAILSYKEHKAFYRDGNTKKAPIRSICFDDDILGEHEIPWDLYCLGLGMPHYLVARLYEMVLEKKLTKEEVRSLLILGRKGDSNHKLGNQKSGDTE